MLGTRVGRAWLDTQTKRPAKTTCPEPWQGKGLTLALSKVAPLGRHCRLTSLQSCLGTGHLGTTASWPSSPSTQEPPDSVAGSTSQGSDLRHLVSQCGVETLRRQVAVGEQGGAEGLD